MSTQFSSVAEAKEYVLSLAGADPASAVKDPDLRILSAGASFLDPNDPDPARAKAAKEIRERERQGQQGYRFTDENGQELGMVVAPFRDGFCVWVIDLKTGTALRL